MDTQSLHAFVTVAETASFSLAAERLFITQPAVSKRILNLEQQLGCKLFDRIGRQVSLTEAGRTLLPKARDILLELDDTRRLLSNLSGAVAGKLSLATSHHISLHRLPPTLRQFSQHYPEVQLDLTFTESETAYEQILHGDIELAIITLAPASHPQIQSAPIWQDELCFTVSPDHLLAQQAKVDLQTLSQHPAILPGTNTFTRQVAEQPFLQNKLNLDVIMSTNNLDTIRMMVSIGLGWSLLPASIIDDSVQVLDVAHKPLIRPLGVIHHRQRTLSNAAKAFMALLQPKTV